MGIQVKNGVLNTRSGTGAQSVTGVGFQPKAVIFFMTKQSVTGNITTEQVMIGFAVSSSARACAGSNSADGAATSAVSRLVHNARCIDSRVAGSVASANHVADFTSMDSDGFTITWSVNTSSNVKIPYLAIGGDTVNAAVGTLAAATSNGNQSVTGLAFQPNLVLFMTNISTTATAANGDSSLSFGAASASAQFATAIRSQNAQATMNTARLMKSDKCISVINSSTDVVGHEASFVSMNADGFTINWTTAPASAFLVPYLALSVPYVDVGVAQQPASASVQTISVGDYTPNAGIIVSASHATLSEVVSTARFALGSTDFADQQAIWAADQDAAADSVAKSRYEANRTIMLYTEATTPTVLAEASINGNNRGNAKLNWSTADATQRYFGYIFMGDVVTFKQQSILI